MRIWHSQLRKPLEPIHEGPHDRRTRVLSDALTHEDQKREQILLRHGACGASGRLETWLPIVPDHELREALRSMRFQPDMTADEVFVRKPGIDQQFIGFLRQPADPTPAPRVHESFGGLLEDPEAHTAQLEWSGREYQTEGRPPMPQN